MTIQAKRIAERREKLDMSQEDLASLVGTSQRQISKYETEKDDPSGTRLAALAAALDTTSDYLLGLTNNPDRLLRGKDDLSADELELIVLYRKKPADKRIQIRDIARVL